MVIGCEMTVVVVIGVYPQTSFNDMMVSKELMIIMGS